MLHWFFRGRLFVTQITLRLFLCCGTLPLRKAKPDPLPMAGVLINDTPVYWSKRTARISKWLLGHVPTNNQSVQVKNSRNFFLFSPLKDIIEIPYSDEIADKVWACLWMLVIDHIITNQIVAFIHQRKLDPNFYTPRNSSHLFTKWLVQTVMPNYKPSGLIGIPTIDAYSLYSTNTKSNRHAHSRCCTRGWSHEKRKEWARLSRQVIR